MMMSFVSCCLNCFSFSSLPDGFNYLHTMSEQFDFRESLTILQSKYGPAPFFRISVEEHTNADTGAFSYDIITIGEGELSLPNKMFYGLKVGHPIVVAFKEMLADIAQRLGILRDQAQLFADEVFHYEQRIVNTIAVVRGSNPKNVDKVLNLGELMQKVPSVSFV